MNATIAQLKTRVQTALVAAFGDDLAETDPLLVPASNPRFGDYQSNVAMSLTKQLKQPPRAIAEQIVQALEVSDLCKPPEIAGPGFINLTLTQDYLHQQLQAMQRDERLGVSTAKLPQRVIVDFSSPNIAKEMHVGHLRSTIIGDSIARVLEFQGHQVLRLNHVGDWGTQFGMLITQLRDVAPHALQAEQDVDLGDLVEFYRQAKQRFDEDEPFRDRARQAVVELQSGDEAAAKAWQILCEQSRQEFQKIYDRLDIQIQERGESFYNPLLPSVVEDLERSGLLVEDQGAQCVFLEGFTNKEGDPLPLIVKKSDGGYNYATTDLAAIRYRTQQDEAERIIYITDAGQANHFAQVFQVAERAGWIPEDVELVHVPFGVVQGEDGKKFKTRSGETVKLKDLLDEAIARAQTDIEQRLQDENRLEPDEFKQHVAEVVGLGSVKYADLSQNRTSNYIFSYDKMLALQGNTAPYLLYAYVRIQGISRKGGIDFDQLRSPSTPTSDVDSPDLGQTPEPSAPESSIESAETAPESSPLSPSAPATNSPQWLAAVTQFTQQVQARNWRPLLNTALFILAVVIAAKVLVAVMTTVHSVPLLPTLMELVGIFAATKFGLRNVLFAGDRQRLANQIQATWYEIVGEPSAKDPSSLPESQFTPTQLSKPTELPTADRTLAAAPDRPELTAAPKRPELPEAIVPVQTHQPAIEIHLTEEAEFTLAKHLLQLDEILVAVETDLLPNRLCQYLFELSQKFNQFFEQCPVLWAEEPTRTSRLALCDLTARTLRLGLSLLGIPVLERM